jgi:molybdenum cofactor synthesis domain-containing protein
MGKFKTAGIIIIGNEILSGKVQDSNSFYLATELRSLGVNVRRISIIPDEEDIIGREVREFSAMFDYVFTSGGVGPTHDDVTMKGIAKGFGVMNVSHPGIKRFLTEKYTDKLNDAVLKMTEVPEGSEVIIPEGIRFPIVVFKNIFIFPGIPEYLRNKFSCIKERFRSVPFFIKKVFLNTRESEIAHVLSVVADENTEVMFGSYPVIKNPEYTVVVTAESRSEELLNDAVNSFIKRIPREKLVRIE